MSNKAGNEPKVPKSSIEFTGEMRELLLRSALAVAQGEMAVDKAIAVSKLCGEANVSLYSEIKASTLIRALGGETPVIGELRMDRGNVAAALPGKAGKA